MCISFIDNPFLLIKCEILALNFISNKLLSQISLESIHNNRNSKVFINDTFILVKLCITIAICNKDFNWCIFTDPTIYQMHVNNMMLNMWKQMSETKNLVMFYLQIRSYRVIGEQIRQCEHTCVKVVRNNEINIMFFAN